MTFKQVKRKSFSVLSGLVTFLVVGFIVVALFFIGINIFLLVVTPVIIFVIIGIVVYRYSGESKKYCPRCNYPTSVYTEYCRNCGLKLISKCPNCNIYTHKNNKYCDICGYEFPAIKEDKIIAEYEVFQKGAPTQKKPNFCPTCGASMKEAKNLRFCEFCGSKIV